MVDSSLYPLAAIGLILTSVGVYRFLKKPKKVKSIESLKVDLESEVMAMRVSGSISEEIRQIGLIPADEFKHFYQPIIHIVEHYSQAIAKEQVDPNYFEIVYKSLRKRRSAIFDFDSAEANQSKKAIWTYALFCSVTIRYLCRLLNHCSFESDDTPPILMTLSELKNTIVSFDESKEQCYPADVVNVHLINRIIPNRFISLLCKEGVYPFVLNSVTGIYTERSNPFYSIIEEVEEYVLNQEKDDSIFFNRAFRRVLSLIENGSISKNGTNSLVHESVYSLVVDRNLLWSLYRNVAVYDEPISKQKFEDQLVKAYELNETAFGSQFFKKIEMELEEESCEIVIENSIELQYKKIPFYIPTHKHRLRKERPVVKTQMTSETVSNSSHNEKDSKIFDGHNGAGNIGSKTTKQTVVNQGVETEDLFSPSQQKF